MLHSTLVLTLLSFTLTLLGKDTDASTTLPVFPESLKKGDTIGIVATASSPKEPLQTISRAVKMLEKKGYRVKIGSNLMTRYGYLAGTDYDRTKAFMEVWLDPQVKAVWCYRGGYGSQRILDRLDYSAIKANPKILIGMSDVTALHAAINKETGLVTFLGPNLNAVYGKDELSDRHYNEKELWTLISKEHCQSVKNRIYSPPKTFSKNSIFTLCSGVARGPLVGGTLSLVVSLIGTPWEIETKGKILILEEVDEEPYRIDRMLCQLKLAGQLQHPAGVILCSWKACKEKAPGKSLTLEQVFQHYFKKAPYPVLVGFPSGHLVDQTTLPLNTLAELDASAKILRLLENPVRD